MYKTKSVLRNVVAIAICLAVTTTFTSCRDDDNGSSAVTTITGSNILGTPTGVTNVKAEIWRWDSQTDTEYSMVIAEAPFRNGAFTLTLATPPANFLTPFFGDEDDIPAGVTINPANARISVVHGASAYNAAGDEIGYFYYANFNWNDESENRPNVLHYALWVYADRDVTATGEVKRSDEWDDIDMQYVWIDNINLNLRRGWNIVYMRETRTTAGNVQTNTHTTTSQRPSGANLRWRFAMEYMEEVTPEAHSATNADRQSVFLRSR